jgi:glycosyltransferase involved in cell wall biosynthesis
MPKVSVIIPIYGVEKYIERCARNLFEQTLEDIEFIFVDDCTKDNSIHVLERVIEDYPYRHDQIKIIHHKCNKGLPQARRTGMSVAIGEYIAHCDSDDWVEKDMYEILYRIAVENNADMVSCNYNEEKNGKTRPVYKTISPKDSNVTLLKRIMMDVGNLNPVWSLLIARDLYDKITFPTSNQSEDFVMVTQFFMRSKKRAVTTKHLYHYSINQQSISHNPDREKCIKRLNEAINNRQLVYNCIKDSIYGDALAKEIIVSKAMTKYFVIKLEKDNEFKPLWNSIFPEVNTSLLFTTGVPLKFRFFHLLVQLNMPCFYNLLKIFPQFR